MVSAAVALVLDAVRAAVIVLATMLLLGLFVAPVVALVLAPFVLTSQEKGGQPPCEEAKGPPLSSRTPVGEEITLTPIAGDRPVVVSFREHRQPRRSRIVLDASNRLVGLHKRVSAVVRGDFIRSDDGERFPREQITSRAVVSSNGRHVTVRLCLDPLRGRPVEPGEYQGSVLIEGPGVQAASLIVDVRLRETRWWMVFLWSILAAVAGVVVKLFVDVVKLMTPVPAAGPPAAGAGGAGAVVAAVPEAEPTVLQKWRMLVRHAVDPATVLSILVGVVGSFGAYFLLYLASDTFGASSDDWLKLTIYCFGATVSGMTLTDLGKRVPARFTA